MAVTLAMLVLDPPLDRLAALVELVRPVVSQTVIVVDDRTCPDVVGVIAGLGVTLVPFAWIDDFAAARNAALEYATGDWILHLDPDELPSRGMLDFIAAVDAIPARNGLAHEGRWNAEALGYLVWTRNWYGGVRGPETEPDWHCRLFRRDVGRWYKPVHEQVELAGLPESMTRGGPLLPKAPAGAYLIHSKPGARIEPDAALYRRLEGVPA